MEFKKNNIQIPAELALNDIQRVKQQKKLRQEEQQQISTMASKPSHHQIQIRSIKFNSKVFDEGTDRHFNSTGMDSYNKTKESKKVEMYLHQVEKGRTRVKMPTAPSQRVKRKKVKEQDSPEALPQYEMHQGPEPQDFLQNTQPSFFDNLMSIQERTRQEDQVASQRHSIATEQDVQHNTTGYFSLYKNNPVLGEDQIRTQYRFKLPALISTLENDNNYLHFNEGFRQSCQFIESIINNVRDEFLKVKQQKAQLTKEIKDLQVKAPKEINEIQAMLPQKIPGYYQILKENFVQQQNQNFITQKTIVLLKRDNNSIQTEIEKALLKIRVLECKLFGLELYELQTQDEMLNNIPQMNLRKDVMKITTNQSKQKQYQYIIH